MRLQTRTALRQNRRRKSNPSVIMNPSENPSENAPYLFRGLDPLVAIVLFGPEIKGISYLLTRLSQWLESIARKRFVAIARNRPIQLRK